MQSPQKSKYCHCIVKKWFGKHIDIDWQPTLTIFCKNFNEKQFFRKIMSSTSFGDSLSLEQKKSVIILQLLYVCLHHSTKTNTSIPHT